MKITDKTEAEIALYTTLQIQAVLMNALRLGYTITAERCQAELDRRKKIAPIEKTKIQRSDKKNSLYVLEFHFVCPNKLGVQANADGNVWTGTWVVDQRLAEAGAMHRSLVALHQIKSEPSYLQGAILDWRRSDREPKYSGDASTKIETGIDFLVEPTHQALPWFGAGSGEKGYRWHRPSD